MNIFFLSLCPRESAQMMCNKHVVKMIIELCQMMWTAFHCTAPDGWCAEIPAGLKVYKKTHHNHPTCIWVRKSKANFQWASAHALEISLEYTRRYKKIHACHANVEWLAHNTPPCNSRDEYSPATIVSAVDYPAQCTPVPLAITNHDYIVRKRGSVSLVESYRTYYVSDKARFAKWKARAPPAWWIED